MGSALLRFHKGHQSARNAGHFRRVSDLLRSSRAGSEMSNHSGGSFTSSLNDSAMLPDSVSYSPSFHHEAETLPPPSPARYVPLHLLLSADNRVAQRSVLVAATSLFNRTCHECPGHDERAGACCRRKTFTRPEMALCLLSEILFEHKEDIREHLAVLLHILTISLDSLQPILQHHAQQVWALAW